MSNRVFVLDSNKQPLMPCHPARARELLQKRKAAVFKRYPFTLILKERVGGRTQTLELKLDPGSQVTGIALVGEFPSGNRCLWAANLQHRGQQIKSDLDSRRTIRRGRRHRKTRYRAPRFNNRNRSRGWLPPSLKHRVLTCHTWASRLLKTTPLTEIATQTVRFDMQKMDNPEISGIQYQQGSLQGYEIREYLLEKWQRQYAYCHSQGVPLEIEHIVPKSRGGSNRVSNLTLACRACNQQKGTQTAIEFGHPSLQTKAKRPLKDAAAVNATRYEIGRVMKALMSKVSFWSGGRTKRNRIGQGYPKDHWLDAVCVGDTGEQVYVSEQHRPLLIKACGWGNRQMCRVNQYGFPRSKPKAVKQVQGFKAGDIVLLLQPRGKYQGVHTGKLAGVRARGAFDIKTNDQKITSSWKNFT